MVRCCDRMLRALRWFPQILTSYEARVRFRREVLDAFGIQLVVKDQRSPCERQSQSIYCNLNQSSLACSFAVDLALPENQFFLVNARFAYCMPIWGWEHLARSEVVWKRFNGKDALQRCVDRLGRNPESSIFMSIEGQREFKKYQLQPYKTGCAHMAFATGLPVVPVFYEGGEEVLPHTSLVPRSGVITIHILPPRHPQDFGDKYELTKSLRGTAEALIAEIKPSINDSKKAR